MTVATPLLGVRGFEIGLQIFRKFGIKRFLEFYNDVACMADPEFKLNCLLLRPAPTRRTGSGRGCKMK